MIILLSGGFDPLHVGHIRMIRDAKRYGHIWVALNSDAWLMRKKGYVFMPFSERAEIVRALYGVGGILPVDDKDDHVANAIRGLRPKWFGNGGDRTTANKFEHDACVEIGCREVFGLGGGKIQSSSELVKATQK